MEFVTRYDSDSDSDSSDVDSSDVDSSDVDSSDEDSCLEDSCDEDPFMGAVGVYERMLNKVYCLPANGNMIFWRIEFNSTH